MTKVWMGRNKKKPAKPLCYAASKYILEENKDGEPICFILPETKFAPETFVCHPKHLDRAIQVFSEFGRPVIDLKRWHDDEYLYF